MEIEAAGKVVETLTAAGSWIIDGIPVSWLYAAVLAGVALYATFFGLGAAAYRTLYK
jgi:xanthine/uracil/vitamin C permease (AzgA family)